MRGERHSRGCARRSTGSARHRLRLLVGMLLEGGVIPTFDEYEARQVSECARFGGSIIGRTRRSGGPGPLLLHLCGLLNMKLVGGREEAATGEVLE